METQQLLLEHIKKGDYIANDLFDVQKIMSKAGMELYAKPCCDRIQEAGLVDDIHISYIPGSPWKLRIDIRGLELCNEILKSYLQPEYLKEIQDVVRECYEQNIICNNILYNLRRIDKEDLRELQCKWAVKGPKGNDLADLARAELKRRSLKGHIRLIFIRLAFTFRAMLELSIPIREFPEFVKVTWGNWSTLGCLSGYEENGKYGKALLRFTTLMGGNHHIDKLQGGDLIKYVYLAVKVYGRELRTEVNHMENKSCIEVENRYRELKRVMGAIGRLTPAELHQMYPVEKDYDGEKWGHKDYFYTMDKLRRLPNDKPIGDFQDAACLLWDYTNKDLEGLLYQWMGVLCDLSVYCGNRDPENEFRDRLWGKEAQNDEQN